MVPIHNQSYALKPLLQWLLLDICANLPVLRAVELFSASPEFTRGDTCGYTAGQHCAWMNRRIANRVKSHGPITSGHAFRVSTAWEEFELRCDELGMNVGYRRISVDTGESGWIMEW